MKHYSSHLIHTYANEVYEERVARHLYEAEVRRLLRRPGPRAKLAAALRRLADRVDHCPVPIYTPSSSMR